MPTLNATTIPPDGVASPSRISFFVGNPPQQMQIFSGVALVDFESGHSTLHETVDVIIGSVSTRNIQFTATADLAAIFNSDSEFIFAVDSATVLNDEHSGQLTLRVALGVQGNKSSLLRFAYNVHVLSDIVDTVIAGTIRWREALGSPSAAAEGGSPIFRVDAGNLIQSAGGGGFGGPSHFQIARSGNSLGVPVRAGGFWAVAYRITAVPLGPNFDVIPALLPNLLVNLPPGADQNSFEFVQARTVQLTPAAPTAVGVDFEMILSQGPR